MTNLLKDVRNIDAGECAYMFDYCREDSMNDNVLTKARHSLSSVTFAKGLYKLMRDMPTDTNIRSVIIVPVPDGGINMLMDRLCVSDIMNMPSGIRYGFGYDQALNGFAVVSVGIRDKLITSRAIYNSCCSIITRALFDISKDDTSNNPIDMMISKDTNRG